MGKSRPVEVRFWEKVEKTDVCATGLCPTGCWLWRAATHQKGYGQFWTGSRKDGSGQMSQAHIWSWEQANGSVPDGLELDHKCRVRNCVNPEHLEPVTHRVNVLRGQSTAAQAARRNSCPKGHEYTSSNTYFDGTKRVCRKCRQQSYLARSKTPKGMAANRDRDRRYKQRNRDLINQRQRERSAAKKV